MTLRNRELAALLTVGALTAIGFATVYIALKSQISTELTCCHQRPRPIRDVLPASMHSLAWRAIAYAARVAGSLPIRRRRCARSSANARLMKSLLIQLPAETFLDEVEEQRR